MVNGRIVKNAALVVALLQQGLVRLLGKLLPRRLDLVRLWVTLFGIGRVILDHVDERIQNRLGHFATLSQLT